MPCKLVSIATAFFQVRVDIQVHQSDYFRDEI